MESTSLAGLRIKHRVLMRPGDGPGAARVERALADRPVMSWINLGEVLYILLRRRGSAAAAETVRDLRAALAVELPTESAVRQAAAIKAAYPMAYADASATAIAHGGELWTGDRKLLVPGVPGAPWSALDLESLLMADRTPTLPLDTPQEFSGAGSHQVRDELGELIERDLLDPWDGETEQLAPNATIPGAVPGRHARPQARPDLHARADRRGA